MVQSWCRVGKLIYRHDDFKDSAYIFIGGIPYELTEGDIICIFSQYGEVLDLNYVRDKETGKPKGFCFLKYDDQRSTVLAVDNFNGATILERTLRVDHSRDYRQKTKKKKRGQGDESESSESEVELDEEGKPRVKGFNVAPKGWLDSPVEETEESEVDDLAAGIDPDDPMRDYLIEKRREERRGVKKQKKHYRKRVKEEGEDEEHKYRRHSHHSSKRKSEDRYRHRHRHSSDHRRIEDERYEENRYQDDHLPERQHRRYDREGTPPSFSHNREDPPEKSHRRDRDDTPPRAYRRDNDETPEKSNGERDRTLETRSHHNRTEDRHRRGSHYDDRGGSPYSDERRQRREA